MRLSRAAPEAVALAALGYSWIDAVSNWSSLPARLPTHFGPSGLPDGYGDRSSALLLPLIGVALWTLLTVIAQFPRYFNYPVAITDENRPRLEGVAVTMLAWIKAEIACIFAYIEWGTLRVALGEASGLGSAFLIVTLMVGGVTIVCGIVAMRKLQ